LYAFVRRKGFAPAEAEDITQAFLLRLLARNVLGHVDRSKGRFRNFLLACLTNFLHNWRDAARADRERLVWWDALAPEERYQTEPSEKSAEAVFDTAWAISLVNQVMEELRKEYDAKGKSTIFEALHRFLIGEVPDGAPLRIATELGRNVNTIKSDLSRMRGEFATVLRREIRDTLAEPTDAEIKAEIRHLFTAIAG
jgi:DNA-directed RNA polymerase specialized sigma24 family protein